MTNAPTLYTVDYSTLLALERAPGQIFLRDHITGFDKNFRNVCLDHISSITKDITHVWWHVILDPRIHLNYRNLRFHGCDSSAKLWFRHFKDYRHNEVDISFQHFVSCFNGSPQIGRQLLAAALHKRNMFSPEVCSKNFVIDPNVLDAQICSLVENKEDINLYLKLVSFDKDFLNASQSFGYDRYRYDHGNNVYNLKPVLTSSFVNLVSEGYSVSYYPFFTEKFLYAVACQSLFLAWAQPQWHWQLSQVWGFKLYSKIFCYDFDWVECPLTRLTNLLDMLGRYQNFSQHDWHDLYLSQREEIMFNYHHLISGDYIKSFQQHA